VKTKYYRINKKNIDKDRALTFSIYTSQANKLALLYKTHSMITQKDIKSIASIDKLYISAEDVQKYKAYISDQTNTKKVPQRKNKFFKVNQKSIDVGDALEFSLYTVVEKKVSALFARGHTITRTNKKELSLCKKLYISGKEVQNFKTHVAQKIEKQKAKADIRTISSEITAILEHIFQTAETSRVRELFPLVKLLTKYLLSKRFQLQKLKELLVYEYTTQTHSLNVALYAGLLGKELKLTLSELNELILSALLHDVGKTKIPLKTLYKVEELSEHEHKELRKHPTMGFSIAREASVINQKILSGIHHHHERLDGSGYPNGLKGEHISLFARIIGICDTYDAMSTNRTFQDSKKMFDVLLEMKKDMQGKLDGELINTFIKLKTA